MMTTKDTGQAQQIGVTSNQIPVDARPESSGFGHRIASRSVSQQQNLYHGLLRAHALLDKLYASPLPERANEPTAEPSNIAGVLELCLAQGEQNEELLVALNQRLEEAFG